MTLAPNPSHLEYVNPVIEGRARADQTSRKGREPALDHSTVVPVLIHGDAAFPGQGVVAETLNLQALDGYSTGGTVHVIANNQLGFTTDPGRGPLDPLRLRPGQGIRHPDHPRERRRRGGVRLGHAAGARIPARVRARRPDRPDRLPALRPQRDRRARLHAAGDVRAHQEPPHRAQALCGAARGAGGRPGRRRGAPGRRRLPGRRGRPRRAEAVARGRVRRHRHARARPDDEPRAQDHRARGPDAVAQRAAREGARRLRGPPQAQADAREAARGRHDRLGPRGVACLRVSARARRAGAADRPGHRARHVQPAAPGAPRREDRPALLPDAVAQERQRAVRAAQQPAVGDRLPRLRVRLQHPGGRRARALGGPVRRLRERGAGDRGPVHRVRASPSGARPRG